MALEQLTDDYGEACSVLFNEQKKAELKVHLPG